MGRSRPRRVDNDYWAERFFGPSPARVQMSEANVADPSRGEATGRHREIPAELWAEQVATLRVAVLGLG